MLQKSLRTRAHRVHTPHAGSAITSNYVCVDCRVTANLLAGAIA